MTYGEAITRLCQLRDEMKKTPQGRQALNKVIRENPLLYVAYLREKNLRFDVWMEKLMEADDENSIRD